MASLELILLVLAVLGCTTAQRWQVVTDELGNSHLFGEGEQSPDVHFQPEQDIRFLLYTQANPEVPHRIANNDLGSVTSSHFNASHPTRIVIHGWLGGEVSRINRMVRTELLELGEFNVIYVDWSAANHPDYRVSRRLVYPAGIATSNLIDFLARTSGLRRDTVAIVGHSLGAHVAGNAGKGQNGRLPTIIGLDPALPFFSGDETIDRIRDTDAEYVEIIHTNGGVMGFLEPIGDADFYPNWGRIQPGCGVDIDGGCAHARAVDYFVESLWSRVGFVSTQCESFQEIRTGLCPGTGITSRMGGEPPNQGSEAPRGAFYVETASGRPFITGC
ncbi:hypothetical protein pipiens_007241 [Culex pipiens pipiens]|uniref:Lipase domain-containing protein n=1 Tax=Culex pipiens pipiens TaxID=38569 RepID=A0ABD1DMF2_CULPP